MKSSTSPRSLEDSSFTTIQGSITIANGAMILEDIILK